MGQGGYFLHFGELFFSPLVRVERKVSLDRRSTRYILELVSFFSSSPSSYFFLRPVKMRTYRPNSELKVS